MMTLALIALTGWFAINMGASGLAPAFGSALGARLISERVATIAFSVFVVLGAVALGPRVAKTLSGALVPTTSFDVATTLCVLGAANLALFGANLVRMPQSTSWVTVASIATVGVIDGVLNARTLTHRLLPAWLLLPVVAFALTAMLVRVSYPLRPGRLDLHSWLTRRRGWLRASALLSACYVALAIGANNVANAAGPLAATGTVGVGPSQWLIAPLFGVGAALLRGPARTVARGVVPLGVATALICNVVVASLLLFASFLGLPQSLVQLSGAAVLAVAWVKEDGVHGFSGQATRRLLVLWLATPAIASALTALFVWSLR